MDGGLKKPITSKLEKIILQNKQDKVKEEEVRYETFRKLALSEVEDTHKLLTSKGT